jgi:hypothetical protein
MCSKNILFSSCIIFLCAFLPFGELSISANETLLSPNKDEISAPTDEISMLQLGLFKNDNFPKEKKEPFLKSLIMKTTVPDIIPELDITSESDTNSEKDQSRLKSIIMVKDNNDLPLIDEKTSRQVEFFNMSRPGDCTSLQQELTRYINQPISKELIKACSSRSKDR